MGNKTYYEILGVKKTAAPDEIAAAKNELAKKYHPDANIKNGIDTTEKMQEILEAYHILSDPDKRADYDRELAGDDNVMQTFDLHNMEETPSTSDPEILLCWRASGALYDIVLSGEALQKGRKQKAGTHCELSDLATRALHHIFILRDADIPEKYWHPDIMNRLLFTWYQNRNYTIPYLLELFDTTLKNDCSMKERLKIQKKSHTYERSLKKLMRY